MTALREPAFTIIFSFQANDPDYQAHLVSAYFNLALCSGIPLGQLHHYTVMHDRPANLQNPFEITERLQVFV